MEVLSVERLWKWRFLSQVCACGYSDGPCGSSRSQKCRAANDVAEPAHLLLCLLPRHNSYEGPLPLNVTSRG